MKTAVRGQGGPRRRAGDVDQDPTVFQWYPGQGLQIQELATFGRANALAKACLPGAKESFPCKADELRAAGERHRGAGRRPRRLPRLGVLLRLRGGRPPWVSSIATGTAIQALTRAAKALNDPSYLEVARASLGAFSTSAPTGVRAKGAVGPALPPVLVRPRAAVFNAFFQSLVGLRDFADATEDPGARRLFADGDREARAELPRPTPARGRATRSAARSPTSATTSSCATCSRTSVTASGRAPTARARRASRATCATAPA